MLMMYDGASEVFDEPEKYNPEQFEENKKLKLPMNMLAWSTGIHACPGRNFSIMEIKTATALITATFKKFDIGPKDLSKINYFSPTVFVEQNALVKLELLSYNINLNNDEYYLNLNKDTWHHPLDKTVIHNYSIIELYVIALDKALKLIQEIDTELIGVHNLDHLKTLFPNLSYLTGFKCEIGDGKYFSY
jgi:hypothetical protein